MKLAISWLIIGIATGAAGLYLFDAMQPVPVPARSVASAMHAPGMVYVLAKRN